MFVLLGSNGQITSQVARRLLAAGCPTRVVGRNAGALAPLRAAGAHVAIGDLSDPDFLSRALAGATSTYTMTPPCYEALDMRAAQERIGKSVARALQRARTRRVVNLSSVGAELAAGTGPIVALHAQERRLDAIDGIELLHLRPGYFMENQLAAASTVAAGRPMTGMEAPDVPMPVVATRDIAAMIERELIAPRHNGVLVLHAPEHATMQATATVFGAATGRPGLRYLQASAVQVKAALRAAGVSADAADQLEELARWLSEAALASVAAAPAVLQPTTVEDFARDVFAPACAQAEAA